MLADLGNNFYFMLYDEIEAVMKKGYIINPKDIHPLSDVITETVKKHPDTRMTHYSATQALLLRGNFLFPDVKCHTWSEFCKSHTHAEILLTIEHVALAMAEIGSDKWDNPFEQALACLNDRRIRLDFDHENKIKVILDKYTCEDYGVYAPAYNATKSIYISTILNDICGSAKFAKELPLSKCEMIMHETAQEMSPTTVASHSRTFFIVIDCFPQDLELIKELLKNCSDKAKEILVPNDAVVIM